MIKFTAKDFKLLNHALDIMASDYDIGNSIGPGPDAYRVKMQKDIKRLRKNLEKLENLGRKTK